MYAVGLMSGTSLDGVDAVLCTIEGVDEDTRVEELAFITLPMPSNLRDRILHICHNNPTTAQDICSLNFELGELFAQAVKAVCHQFDPHFQTKDLGFVASHGQTLYHMPQAQGTFRASTLQLGDGATIARLCECPVVYNFRTNDMAYGGQGAPLVPYSEYLLYRSYSQGVMLQNMGGIGNITVIPPNACTCDVFAFDTGPANMAIDQAMRTLFNTSYDKDGACALSGTVIPMLQKQLKQHPYLTLSVPKTTGREDFGAQFTSDILERYCSHNHKDLVATLTWFSAYCIEQAIRGFVWNKHHIKTLILSGGGAHNKAVRKFLKELLPELTLLTQEDLGFSSDVKEALAFVILGNQTLHGRPSNIPSATGASKPVILGSITYPS